MKRFPRFIFVICLSLAGCGGSNTNNHPGEYPDNFIPRETLTQLGDEWLDAVAIGDYHTLPASEDLRFTHNAILRPLNADTLHGREIWGRRYYADVDKGQIVVYADTPQGPYNARLRISNDQITEIESWQGVGVNYWPQGAIAAKPLSRERLIQLTEAHLQSLQTGIPTARYTFDVIRTDNGQPFYGLPTCIGILCAGEMPILGAVIKSVKDRRKIIDTRHNVVVTWIEWHFNNGSILPMSARFLMRNDAIAVIEVTFNSEGNNHMPGWIDQFQPE